MTQVADRPAPRLAATDCGAVLADVHHDHLADAHHHPDQLAGAHHHHDDDQLADPQPDVVTTTLSKRLLGHSRPGTPGGYGRNEALRAAAEPVDGGWPTDG